MCITDTAVYSRTRGKLGYDLCTEGFFEGVLVFEDTFEDSSISSPWADLRNGVRDKFCGSVRQELQTDPLFTEQSQLIGYTKYLSEWEDRKGHALIFMNEPIRRAVTPPLNVEYGGEVMFAFKYGMGAGEDNLGEYPKCKRLNDGLTNVEYSIDGGETWFILKTLRQVPYQSRYFTPVRLKLPEKASTASTIFRWYQQSPSRPIPSRLCSFFLL